MGIVWGGVLNFKFYENPPRNPKITFSVEGFEEVFEPPVEEGGGVEERSMFWYISTVSDRIENKGCREQYMELIKKLPVEDRLEGLVELEFYSETSLDPYIFVYEISFDRREGAVHEDDYGIDVFHDVLLVDTSFSWDKDTE